MATMTTDKEWTIWLMPGAGELFLGLPARSAKEQAASRYCVICTMKEESLAGVGAWVEVSEVQERALVADSRVLNAFTVHPKTCLIPWGLVAYIQRGRRSESIGFVQVKS
jgi:hypothetical protein